MTQLQQDKLTRVALVTGCSSGFGLRSAIELARYGFQVIATVRSMKSGEQFMEAAAAAEVVQLIQLTVLDVRVEEQVYETIQMIHNNYGRLDVLVNNAGEAYGGMIEELPMQVWRDQMETNFFGMVNVTRSVLPLMRAQGGGRIIQISSISGEVGFPGLGPYVSSKFAMEGFSESLALEVREFGIEVVLIQPGSYGTPIWEKSFSRLSMTNHSPYRELFDRVLSFSKRSSKEGGNPQEVARLVARAATISSPLLRYRLPRGTKLTVLMKQLLPDRIFQRIMLHVLKK